MLAAQSCPALWPHGLQPTRLLCPWGFPGKDTGVVYHFLLQGIFPTQGLNLGLLHCRWILHWLSYQGSPYNGILPSHWKEWNMASCGIWMDLKIDILSEVKSGREGDIPYVWNLKRNDTNELIYQTETDSQRRNLRFLGKGIITDFGMENTHCCV